MKLLVFTGTGNSFYIAKKIQNEFQGEILSIPKLFNEKTFDIESESIGIILPIYALEIPNMVDEYLQKVNIKTNYLFVIFNHALFSFDTKSLIHRYKFDVDYVAQLKMHNNYLPVFDMSKTKNSKIDYENKINDVIKDIKEKKLYSKKDSIKFFIGNIIRKLNKENYKNEDKKFYVSNDCTKCGVCKKVCVSNNIEIENGIKFLHRCEQCLACIQLCPSKAIHHKKEKNSERYKHEKVKLSEIIELND